MPTKKLLTAAALSAALAAGGAGGVLLGRPLVTTAQESDDPAATEDAAGGHAGHEGLRASLDAAAEALGVSGDEFRTALRDGKTVADVASDKGVDVQTVIDAMVAAATDAIDERVASGDLDADRAADLKAELPDRVTRFVNEGPDRGPRSERFFGGLGAAADALGMSESDLRSALRDGKTIADLASERGVDLQTVIDAMVAEATDRIDERVADLKDELPDRISDLVNGRLPEHPGREAVEANLEAAASALGVSSSELRDALHDGKTIADVASDQGVEVQTVIDAMVAEASARIDDRVASGDLDADRAAELKDRLPDRIADVVNGEGPGLRSGPHRGPGPGFGFGFGD